jgi:hypothetical protein
MTWAARRAVLADAAYWVRYRNFHGFVVSLRRSVQIRRLRLAQQLGSSSPEPPEGGRLPILTAPAGLP